MQAEHEHALANPFRIDMRSDDVKFLRTFLKYDRPDGWCWTKLVALMYVCDYFVTDGGTKE